MTDHLQMLDDRSTVTVDWSSLDDAHLLQLAVLGTTMVESTPEPYKNLFLEHLDALHITDIQPGGQPLTWPGTSTIRVDVDALLADQPAPLWTFFHEYGHLIDQNSTTPGYDSPDYTFPGPDGVPHPLSWWLQQDVRNNLQTTFNNPKLGLSTDPAQQQRIIDAILSHDLSTIWGWTDETHTAGDHGSDAQARVC